MNNIEQILEDHGVNKDSLEASLELARLVSAETGLCCAALGQLAWACYEKLEGESEE